MAEGNPTPVLEDEGFKLEVVEEGAQKDDTTLALEAQIAELTAQKEQLAQTVINPTPPTDGGMEALAEAIAKMNKTPEPAPTPSTPSVDFGALMAEIDGDFYKNKPSESMVKLMTPLLQQMKAEADQTAKTQEVQISKLTALSNDDNKALYGKYSDEVEAVAKELGPGSNTYQQAIAQVKMNHIEDIVAERTEAALAAQVAAVEAEAKKTVQLSGPTVTSAGVPRVSAPQRVTATPAQVEMMQQFALTKGYNWNDPGDQEFLYNYFKRKGALK